MRRIVRGLPTTSATLALLAGYALLWQGGTLAPAGLLVVGYCVLVPLAILRGGRAA